MFLVWGVVEVSNAVVFFKALLKKKFIQHIVLKNMCNTDGKTHRTIWRMWLRSQKTMNCNKGDLSRFQFWFPIEIPWMKLKILPWKEMFYKHEWRHILSLNQNENSLRKREVGYKAWTQNLSSIITKGHFVHTSKNVMIKKSSSLSRWKVKKQIIISIL